MQINKLCYVDKENRVNLTLNCPDCKKCVLPFAPIRHSLRVVLITLISII